MPVFELGSFARLMIRVALFLTFIAYLVSVIGIVSDIILNFWNLVTTSIDHVAGSMSSGGSSNALSCTLYMMNELGIFSAVSSFLFSFVSLLILWGVALVHLISIRYSILFHKYVMGVLK